MTVAPFGLGRKHAGSPLGSRRLPTNKASSVAPALAPALRAVFVLLQATFCSLAEQPTRFNPALPSNR
jgi:hypothetical protein